MKQLSFALLASSLFSFAAHADCSDMASTPGIIACLEYRTEVAEKLLKTNLTELSVLSSAKDSAQATALSSSQKAWVTYRNATCSLAESTTTGGEEKGITGIACKLSQTLKRVAEVEELLDAEKTGVNKSFRDVLTGLVESRDTDMSQKKIASKLGVKIINGEYEAAHQALMSLPEVLENKLRIKSLKMMNEGRTSVCKKASEYIAELGYFAQKTQKYVKIYVISDVNKDRSVKAVRTSVQMDIDALTPNCP